MSTPSQVSNRSNRGSGGQSWLERTSNGRRFTNWQTLALSLTGSSLIVTAVVAIFVTTASDAAKTGLLAAGSIALLLALMGRLPSKLAFGQWEVEFGKEQLDELFGLIKSEAPEIFDAVVQITRDGARDRKVIDEAVKSAHNEAAEERSVENSALSSPRESLGTPADSNPLKRNFLVNVPSPGRPPIVDAVFPYRNRLIAIEFKTTWSPTVARVVKARIERVLTSPEILGAVLVVTPAALQDALQLVDDDRVLVTSHLDLAAIEGHFAGR